LTLQIKDDKFQVVSKGGRYMDIRETLLNEMETEQKLLNYYESIITEDKTILYLKEPENRPKQFFYRKVGEKQIHYIKKSESDKLMEIFISAFNRKAADILRANIGLMTDFSHEYKDYDSESIMKEMKTPYRKAAEDLAMSFNEEDKSIYINSALQSENDYRMARQYAVSNGLIVRSKSEALIAEYLLAAGIPFKYEVALDLEASYFDEAGFEHIVTERVYPDFTIYLPDGNVMLWEHEGMMDKEDYRKRNLYKMMLYYRNGYYVPHNLIFTMESNDRLFDSGAARRIVDGFLKPLFSTGK
jgi:hypothetical protein